MNKIFLILVILLTFSCSSSDDSNPTEDPFVGKWFFGPEVYKLDNGQDYTFPLQECQDQGWFIFNANGSGQLFDSQVNPNGGCMIVQYDENFGWEKLSNGQYRFIGYSDDTLEVVFENDNVMYWRDTFGDGFQIDGVPYHERWSYFYK